MADIVFLLSYLHHGSEVTRTMVGYGLCVDGALLLIVILLLICLKLGSRNNEAPMVTEELVSPPAMLPTPVETTESSPPSLVTENPPVAGEPTVKF